MISGHSLHIALKKVVADQILSTNNTVIRLTDFVNRVSDLACQNANELVKIKAAHPLTIGSLWRSVSNSIQHEDCDDFGVDRPLLTSTDSHDRNPPFERNHVATLISTRDISHEKYKHPGKKDLDDIMMNCNVLGKEFPASVVIPGNEVNIVSPTIAKTWGTIEDCNLMLKLPDGTACKAA